MQRCCEGVKTMKRIATLWTCDRPGCEPSIEPWPPASEFEDALALELGWQETPLVKQDVRLHGLLLWALYHHQGGSSPVGQPIRRALGIGEHDHLSPKQIELAKAAAVLPFNAELTGDRRASALDAGLGQKGRD
jgi:hypothetical protein